jgi:hypothetical protein
VGLSHARAGRTNEKTSVVAIIRIKLFFMIELLS